MSIHQPHVGLIVRGKANAKVEFGAKIQVSVMNGFAFLEELSWKAFNEGRRLLKTRDQYSPEPVIIQQKCWPIRSTATERTEQN